MFFTFQFAQYFLEHVYQFYFFDACFFIIPSRDLSDSCTTEFQNWLQYSINIKNGFHCVKTIYDNG